MTSAVAAAADAAAQAGAARRAGGAPLWSLVAVALVSGGLLLWPILVGGVGGGVAPNEAVRLMNRAVRFILDDGPCPQSDVTPACALLRRMLDEFEVPALHSDEKDERTAFPSPLLGDPTAPYVHQESLLPQTTHQG